MHIYERERWRHKERKTERDREGKHIEVSWVERSWVMGEKLGGVGAE